ncbi:hypothetical protein COCC4DRAFT_21737 [Bipolaris maydis ATCC 48331]|uniref:Uncharacterized protein n=2 Tax=Cochliobolus heterostrophus TaxID=5016 RepID=M2V0S1_COCH5|nr:uncharacterized protein COCC4DRAFT_21737 [Bipolaris maydis ATCC 48331]EMD93562.1 hypothetical protein COCHEDRAFT_1028729 [Bipolaris maydis C5]ENI06989.1 hypothetical protein COCC4DRAFT_21737 [Bipolaris maydis ATCC 48331]
MPMGLPVWSQSSLTCIETPLRLTLPAHMDFVLPAVRQVAVFLKRLAGIYRPVTADYAAMLFISNFIRRTFMIDMDRWTCIHLKRKYSEGFGKSVQSCCLALRNTKNAGANQQPYQGYIQYAPCLSGCGPRSVPCKRYHAAYPLR